MSKSKKAPAIKYDYERDLPHFMIGYGYRRTANAGIINCNYYLNMITDDGSVIRVCKLKKDHAKQMIAHGCAHGS